MRRDLIGLIGCIICGMLLYLAITYISPGEGNKLNPLKVAALFGLAPLGIYSVIMLLGGPGDKS